LGNPPDKLFGIFLKKGVIAITPFLMPVTLECYCGTQQISQTLCYKIFAINNPAHKNCCSSGDIAKAA
jgi:hypothetical protein